MNTRNVLATIVGVLVAMAYIAGSVYLLATMQVACVSIVWMFIGAFSNNKGKLFGGLIALSARTTASMLFLTWLSKLIDMKNKYHDDNVGFADYAKSAISFIIFGIWFKMLVVPLVADNRSED